MTSFEKAYLTLIVFAAVVAFMFISIRVSWIMINKTREPEAPHDPEWADPQADEHGECRFCGSNCGQCGFTAGRRKGSYPGELTRDQVAYLRERAEATRQRWIGHQPCPFCGEYCDLWMARRERAGKVNQ